jgi:MFS family permease
MGRTADNLRFYRPFLPLFGGIFFCLLAVGAALGALPFYVRDELDGNNVEIGVVIATISVAAVIGRPIAGRIADRRGYRTVMLAGALICALASAAYLLAGSVPALVAVRLLHGVGEGAVYTAGAAWLVALSPTERRGRVVGLYGISMWSGVTLGALLGTVTMRASGFPAVWLGGAVVTLIGLLLVATKERPAQPQGSGPAAFFPATALAPGVALSLAALGYAALAAFVSLHMAERGMANGIAALNAYGVTYVGVRLFVGHWPDRYGAAVVAFWSALVEAVGLLVLAVAPNLVVAITGGLIIGAGLSLLFPALALLVINRTDKAHQGAALGTFTSFWDIGLAAGGPLAGAIASGFGYPAIYWTMVAAAVVSAAISSVGALRRQPTPA